MRLRNDLIDKLRLLSVHDQEAIVDAYNVKYPFAEHTARQSPQVLLSGPDPVD